MLQQPAANHLVTVTDDTFPQAVLANEHPVVVDFWATWCPSCTRISASLTDLASEFAGKIVIATVNADENPTTVRTYGVLSLPTLLVFRHGDVVGSVIGAKPKSMLRQTLLDHAALV